MTVFTALEFILLLLLICAFILGIILICVFFYHEVNLHNRRKINYHNYHEYKKLFVIKISNKIIAASIIEFILLCGCIILTNFTYILDVYLSPALILLIIIFILLINYCTSKKFNLDISIFDEYHKKVTQNYSLKDIIEENITLLKSKEKEFNKRITYLNQKLLNLLKNSKKISTNIDSIKTFKDIEAEQIELYNSFDKVLSDTFNKIIQEYIFNGGKILKETNIFNPNIDIPINSMMKEIYSAIDEQFLSIVEEGYKHQKHLNTDALKEILIILIENKRIGIEEADNLVEMINRDPDTYSNIASILFANKYINVKHIKNCIENDLEWIFDNPIISIINCEELIEIVNIIIKKNNIHLTNKFLIFTSSNIVDNLVKAISKTNITNESTVLISHYIKILDQNSAFNNLSNRYESIALILKQYYHMNADYNADINEIIRKETFYESRVYLDATYYSLQKDLEFIFSRVFKSLLYYSLYADNKLNYFVQHKINKLYVEYKQSLNIPGLLCLAALLDGLMLFYIDDNKVKQLIYDNIELKDFKINDNMKNIIHTILPKYFPKTTNFLTSKYLYGKDLILNLLNNNKSSLYTIVNHIERERLMINKIKNI